MRYLIAVDGGGSGCRALIADRGGAVLGRGESGAANIKTDPEGSLSHILEAAARAAKAAGLSGDVLEASDAVLGLAGANVGTVGEALRGRLPFARSRVETDIATAARGALGPHDGAIAILGTGSVFAVRHGGAVRTVGGWGFRLGDQGSGARLGRSVLQETLLVLDGIRPGSGLTTEVAARFADNQAQIVEWAHDARPGDFAAYAPMVFDHADRDDALARNLVESAIADIEETLTAVMPAGCDRLCLLGGLASRYAGRLGAPFRVILRKPLGDALDGALALAVQRFAAKKDSANA